MDDFDTGPPRRPDISGSYGAAVDPYRADIRSDDTSGDPGKSRLAGAILSDDGVDHAWGEAETDSIECNDVPVGHGDIAALQRRQCWAAHVHSAQMVRRRRIRARC